MDNQPRRVAAIDVGSNTVRLMIADLGANGAINPVSKELVMTRIYEGSVRTGKLSDVAMERTLDAINILKDKARGAGAESLYCFATAAVREAKNRDEFLARAMKETSMSIDVLDEDAEVLDEEAEARVGFIGTQEFGARGALDIGGGSTEIAVGMDQSVHCSISMKLGAVRALEKYPLGDPPDTLALEAMRQWAAGVLEHSGSEAREAARNLPGIRWTGIGGTVTTLAAMDLKLSKYDSVRVQGRELMRASVEKTLVKLAQTPLEKRRQIAGLQPERADIIIGGVAILLEFMLYMGVERIFVSDRDNLEGYLAYKLGGLANSGTK
jgi:exopolyphosphatase/guanosine-5'-triphosphate,3'-diphosphate pyrophosphatase